MLFIYSNCHFSNLELFFQILILKIFIICIFTSIEISIFYCTFFSIFLFLMYLMQIGYFNHNLFCFNKNGILLILS